MLMSLLKHGEKYTNIPAPALVIFANPHSLGTWVEDNPDPSIRADVKVYSAALTPLTEKQEEAVQSGAPRAHVITLPNANHHVFLSNEAEVLKEMRAFLAGLPE